jgi:hypothetical protein
LARRSDIARLSSSLPPSPCLFCFGVGFTDKQSNGIAEPGTEW